MLDRFKEMNLHCERIIWPAMWRIDYGGEIIVEKKGNPLAGSKSRQGRDDGGLDQEDSDRANI